MRFERSTHRKNTGASRERGTERRGGNRTREGAEGDRATQMKRRHKHRLRAKSTFQCEHGLPVLSQNVQAHLAIHVDVGVVHLEDGRGGHREQKRGGQ